MRLLWQSGGTGGAMTPRQRRPKISPQPGGVANMAETQANGVMKSAPLSSLFLSMEKQRPLTAR